MKTRKLIRRLYKAIVKHNLAKEAKIYRKLLKKSLKGKNTSVVN
jgi:hemerythrin superfamily protein